MNAMEMREKCNNDALTLRSAIAKLIMETDNVRLLHRVWAILERAKSKF